LSQETHHLISVSVSGQDEKGRSAEGQVAVLALEVHGMGLDEFIAAVRSRGILERYRLRELILFGSFARGETARDIDIFVEDDNDMDSLIDLRRELEELSGMPVDLVPKRYANPIVMVRARRDFVHVGR
jgi:predicted nucleotidyltransferase